MAFKGVRLSKSSAATGQNFTTQTVVTWDQEDFDTDAFHDTGSNTSRITIPSGVTRVQLFGLAVLANQSSNDRLSVEIKKNGSPLSPAVKHNSRIISITTNRAAVTTPVLEVSAGDYFEFFVQTAADTSSDLTTESFFAAMAAPNDFASYSGALVNKAADQTTADYTTATVMAFDAESHDVGGWHDNATNNSRLTVPSGVSYIILNAQVGLNAYTSAAGSNIIRFKKNGSAYITVASANTAAASVPRFWGCSGPIAVSSGDYFEFEFECGGDSSITIESARTFFSAFAVG